MDIVPVRRARLRAVLAAHGAAPLKRYGQHFLVDDGVLRAIVRDAHIVDGEQVLEVGPGPGLLTRYLLAAGARVTAIEIDLGMEGVARDLVEPDLWSGLEWIRTDAMAGRGRLSDAMRAACKVCTRMVANLPYRIAAPLLASVVALDEGPERLVVTVQRELAARMMASPGTRDYGPLTVVVGLCCRVTSLRRLPPEVFWPPPKVSSSVLELARRASRPPSGAIRDLESFLAAAFHNRRKTMLNSLREATGLTLAQVAERLGGREILQKVRAEAVETVELYELASQWAAHATGER